MLRLECPQDWHMVKLSDLGEVNRGRSRHRPRHAPFLYGGRYPFIQTGDIKASGGRITSHTQTYSEAGLAQSRLWPAGTMCITIAANIAETAILTYPACFPDSVIGFIADPEKADVRFVELIFRRLRSLIQGMMAESGTVQDNINVDFMERLHFPIPPTLAEQRAIARVLGGLDDKIELNRRMNRTLEDLARGVFRSWFVDFDPVLRPSAARPRAHPANHAPPPPPRFPTRLVDSPLGPIPEGWRVGTVGEEFNLTMGQSPPGSTYNEDGLGVPFYQGRTDFGFRFPTRRVHCTAPTRFAEAGDTLVSVRAPVGDINMADERCAAGRGVAAVRHKSGATSYTYAMMAALREAFDVFNGDGTLFGCIGKSDFDKMQVLVPPPEVVAAFERVAGPWDAQIALNEKEARSLAATRDALLPVLLSGEVRLRNEREAERAVDDSLQSTRTPPRAGGNGSPRGGKVAGTAKGRA